MRTPLQSRYIDMSDQIHPTQHRRVEYPVQPKFLADFFDQNIISLSSYLKKSLRGENRLNESQYRAAFSTGNKLPALIGKDHQIFLQRAFFQL